LNVSGVFRVKLCLLFSREHVSDHLLDLLDEVLIDVRRGIVTQG